MVLIQLHKPYKIFSLHETKKYLHVYLIGFIEKNIKGWLDSRQHRPYWSVHFQQGHWIRVRVLCIILCACVHTQCAHTLPSYLYFSSHLHFSISIVSYQRNRLLFLVELTGILIEFEKKFTHACVAISFLKFQWTVRI